MTAAKHEAPAEGAGEALLPCPFCGGDAEIVHIEDGENEGGSCVCCTVCQASGNVEFERKENFISNWNRRARSSSPEAREDGYRRVDLGMVATTIETMHRRIEELTGSRQSQYDGAVSLARDLYLTAAPSADKLRIAVEALEPFQPGPITSAADPDDIPDHIIGTLQVRMGDLRRVGKAIAALKA